MLLGAGLRRRRGLRRNGLVPEVLMQATSEIAKLKREIASLREIVARPRGVMSAAEKRSLKSDIERCILELDELRAKLSG